MAKIKPTCYYMLYEVKNHLVTIKIVSITCSLFDKFSVFQSSIAMEIKETGRKSENSLIGASVLFGLLLRNLLYFYLRLPPNLPGQ